jgi:hypothetical protein
MRLLRFSLLTFSLGLFAGEVSAQSTGRVKFQTKRPNPAVTAYGYYVGPFYGTLLSDPTRPTIDLFCVDILNSVHWGEEWNVNFTRLTNPNFSRTRHGNDDKDKYIKAAWLADQYDNTPTQEWGGLQAAIWNLLNPGSPNGGAAEANWLNQVNSWFLNPSDVAAFDMGRWTVVTATGAAGLRAGGGPQEFLTTSVTPEPETWVLMGTGLVLVLGAAFKRSRLV